jgi:hypothetical protein
VRDVETGLVDGSFAVEEQVEVDRARAPARALPNAAQLSFDVEEAVEQLAGRQLGLDLGDGVQERRLVDETPRLGLADRREARCVEQLRGAADLLLAVAEVRA